MFFEDYNLQPQSTDYRCEIVNVSQKKKVRFAAGQSIFEMDRGALPIDYRCDNGK
jgi:hypothetical protein